MRMFYASDNAQTGLLPFHIVTIGTEHKQEPRYRPRGTDFHHILVVEKGEGVFETTKGTFRLGAGTVVFIHKNSPINYYKHTDDFQTGWVTFDGTSSENLFTYFHLEDFTFCKSDVTASLIVQCYRLARRGASPERLSQALYEILVTFFTELHNANSSPHLVMARSFMEEHFMEDISVEDIAAAAGISQSLLYRLFHDEEHTTPVAQLQQLRLQKAKQLLLRHPEMKISEVAARCGYADCANFCKIFKAQSHLTPKAFIARYLL